MPSAPNRVRGSAVPDALNNNCKAYVCYAANCKKLIPLIDSYCACGFMRPDCCVCAGCARSYDPEVSTSICTQCGDHLPHSVGGRAQRLSLQTSEATAQAVLKAKPKTQKGHRLAMSRLVAAFKMSSGSGSTGVATRARGAGDILFHLLKFSTDKVRDRLSVCQIVPGHTLSVTCRMLDCISRGAVGTPDFGLSLFDTYDALVDDKVARDMESPAMGERLWPLSLLANIVYFVNLKRDSYILDLVSTSLGMADVKAAHPHMAPSGDCKWSQRLC